MGEYVYTVKRFTWSVWFEQRFMEYVQITDTIQNILLHKEFLSNSNFNSKANGFGLAWHPSYYSDWLLFIRCEYANLNMSVGYDEVLQSLYPSLCQCRTPVLPEIYYPILV